MNLGYACINMSLGKKVTTNRTMIKRTFLEKGLDYVSDCVIQNVADLEKIIDWNEQNGIKMYRMSSDMMPWATEYDFTQFYYVFRLSFSSHLRILSFQKVCKNECR